MAHKGIHGSMRGRSPPTRDAVRLRRWMGHAARRVGLRVDDAALEEPGLDSPFDLADGNLSAQSQAPGSSAG